MKLYEILTINATKSNNFDIIVRQLSQKIHIKDNIYSLKINNMDVFCILDDAENLIAYLLGQKWFSIKISNGFVVLEVFVDVDHRRQGVASTLYEYLFRDLNMTIISDKHQSLVGAAIWQALRKQYQSGVKIYNTENDTIVDYDTIPNSQLYIQGSSDSTTSLKYRLILLKEQLKNNMPTLSGQDLLIESSNRFMTPYQLCWF